MTNRPNISRRTIPNLPWGFIPEKESVCFVLGIANTSWPQKDAPKGWPIAYKTLRWHRLDILRANKQEFLQHGKQYVYLKDTTGQGHTIQAFIDRSIEAIKKEKSKGKIRSVHSIAVIFDPHGKDELEIFPLDQKPITDYSSQ